MAFGACLSGVRNLSDSWCMFIRSQGPLRILVHVYQRSKTSEIKNINKNTKLGPNLDKFGLKICG